MAPIFGYLPSDEQPLHNPVREGLPPGSEHPSEKAQSGQLCGQLGYSAPQTCLVSYAVSRPLVPYAYRPGRTPTSKLKLCCRVGDSAPPLSEPIGRVSDASHGIDSLFVPGCESGRYGARSFVEGRRRAVIPDRCFALDNFSTHRETNRKSTGDYQRSGRGLLHRFPRGTKEYCQRLRSIATRKWY